MSGLVEGLPDPREGVVWIRRMLPRAELCQVLTAATAFVCPSVYEPLGIVNLEAMACETAVVATATAASPRSSSTARPGGSCRSTRSATAPAPAATRSGSSPTWPRR